MREVQQNFETLGTDVQFTRICKEVGFIRDVAVGRIYRTALDVDDGFGDRTLVCREESIQVLVQTLIPPANKWHQEDASKLGRHYDQDEESTALFIGIRWNRDCEMRS